MNSFEYTQYAEILIENIKDEFDIYYSREMVQDVLNKFRRSSKRDSNHLFLKTELEEMLTACKITGYNINNPDSIEPLLDKIPGADEIYRSIFRKLYEISKTFRHPKDYMSRLVKRLADPEFRNDSTALAIVKQFIKHTDFNTEPVIEYVISKSPTPVDPDKRCEYTLEHITDDIFTLIADGGSKTELSEGDLIKIESRVLLSKFENELKITSLYDTLKKIEEKTASGTDELSEADIQTAREIKSRILENNPTIRTESAELTFPLSECKKEYFLFLAEAPYIDAISVKDSKQTKKCFRNHSKYKTDSSVCDRIKYIIEHFDECIAGTEYEEAFLEFLNNTGSEILKKINKESSKLFNKYNNERKKDARKSVKGNENMTLLKLADSLASGNFYTNGKTKNDLYMFAFAFNMTYSLNPDYSTHDTERDIDKNLFHDYYNLNLMSYVKHDSSYEAEPTGTGINIKNFVEVIYLYYLAKNELSIREKIKRAEKTIEKCKKSFKSIALNNSSEMTKTIMYISLFNVITQLSEDELVSYICDHFLHDEKNNSASAITSASEELTAYENCCTILKEIEYAKGSVSDLKYECGIEDIEEELRQLNITDENFIQLITNMNKMLDAKTTFFTNPDPDKKKIKRTDLITLAYYYKILESGDAYDSETRNFVEIYEDFCDYINPVLIESRYQPVSPKNIFDMFVLLNLYRLAADTPLQK